MLEMSIFHLVSLPEAFFKDLPDDGILCSIISVGIEENALPVQFII